MTSRRQFLGVSAAAAACAVGARRAAAERAVGQSMSRKFGLRISPEDFGAVGDGRADDTVALQAAINAVPHGGTLQLSKPASYYRISSALTISSPSTLFSTEGAEIRQTGANASALIIKSSDVHLDGLTLRGPQSAIQYNDSRAITVFASTAAAPYSGLTVRRCHIEAWGKYGIFFQHVTDFDISNNWIGDINYAGVGVLSALRGRIAKNSVDGVTNKVDLGSGRINAYGIAVSRSSVTSLVTDPRSEDVDVVGNIIKNVPGWEALDTHGGQRISFRENTTYNCGWGVSVVCSSDSTGVDRYAPLDCLVEGNIIDSGVTDGSRDVGIAFSGAFGSPGAPTEKATGSIRGNTVRGHGAQTSEGSGGIWARDTQRLVVTGNACSEPSPNGILLSRDNYGFSVTGNTVTDPWSEVQVVCAAVSCVSGYNLGFVGGNTLARGERTAKYVCTHGLYVWSTASQRVEIGNNDFRAAVVLEIRDLSTRKP